MLPPGWKIEQIIPDADTTILRKWLLTDPDGKSTKWKTRVYAIKHAERVHVKEQTKKVRSVLVKMKRKYRISFDDISSASTESHYFVVRNRTKNMKIRISAHNTVDDSSTIDVVADTVDACELRSVIRKKLIT